MSFVSLPLDILYVIYSYLPEYDKRHSFVQISKNCNQVTTRDKNYQSVNALTLLHLDDSNRDLLSINANLIHKVIQCHIEFWTVSEKPKSTIQISHLEKTLSFCAKRTERHSSFIKRIWQDLDGLKREFECLFSFTETNFKIAHVVIKSEHSLEAVGHPIVSFLNAQLKAHISFIAQRNLAAIHSYLESNDTAFCKCNRWGWIQNFQNYKDKSTTLTLTVFHAYFIDTRFFIWQVSGDADRAQIHEIFRWCVYSETANIITEAFKAEKKLFSLSSLHR